ncbi:putative odorant receptor 85d [Leptopilina boulardi]|uniref:putative odorant receptor 85d n=1 Tax=Leptopilina boulardi TaxID=63433 RepID=UPI0021F56114|nr:putative odorant receptor 85d [Leptopilina boulardi]
MMGFRDCHCFKCIIEHHVQLRRNLKIIQDTFNVTMLMQFTSNVIVLCIQGYTIVKAMSDGNLFGLISYILYIFFSTFNVFMYCSLGERVIQKSVSISREIYEMRWYRMDIKYRRLLIIIINRSNKPFELKAGHFFTMCLATYKGIIVTAFSYASCLLALSEK